jgi:hypothetical protein
MTSLNPKPAYATTSSIPASAAALEAPRRRARKNHNGASSVASHASRPGSPRVTSACSISLCMCGGSGGASTTGRNVPAAIQVRMRAL